MTESYIQQVAGSDQFGLKYICGFYKPLQTVGMHLGKKLSNIFALRMRKDQDEHCRSESGTNTV